MIIPSITHLHALVVRSATTDVEAGSASSSTSDSCNDINDCRTLLQIVWSCVSVLIACTWVSVHPNVPGPHDSSWKVLRRKIGLMIIALIAPELLVLWAARQWFAARKLSERYPEWTRTHAFFALMGGFALYKGKECVAVLRYETSSWMDWHISESFQEPSTTGINNNAGSTHGDDLRIPLTAGASMSSDDDPKQRLVADNEVEPEDHPLAASYTAVKCNNPTLSHNDGTDTIVSTNSNLKFGTQIEEDLKDHLLGSLNPGSKLNNPHSIKSQTTPTLWIAGKLAELHASPGSDLGSFLAHSNLIGRIPEAEIKDRSHSDGFSKLIAVMQTTWFVVQLLARWIEGLPVTELEVMTLAFAAMNVLIYFFWWDKPQGVGCPVHIVRKSADEDVIDPLAGASAQSKEGWIATAWNGVQDILHNVLNPVPYNLASIIVKVIITDHPGIRESKMVSSFERTTKLEPKNAQDKFIAYGAAVMFGAIHCAA
ncbi:hypothetical protein GYMLUDRAFT_922656 [Collybiopsis luxurians FD-317 M1]|uniref:Uncharacterized protein n=1 Tax=Collybiopsis luxurians FD-317 M1 TaxID=944289 RepID=A0A0D0ATW2_9AGAR|nr:hypothetical protein GYMLUDRAFT_922656 [Collybiopsis luxurians FD-317 M1]